MKSANLLTLAAVLAASSLVDLSAASAADKVRFQTDWLPSGERAMYYGGWQKGIFADEGIDITITRGYGSGDTVTKLAGGAFDFGVADVAAGFCIYAVLLVRAVSSAKTSNTRTDILAQQRPERLRRGA
jgi:NitT/TauT family transport system substrate-binding protein